MYETVSPDGVRLRYRVDGPATGPPLLLSNSLGTTLDLWAPQIDTLAARFRVIRYDTRGHGGSSVPPGEYSLADLGHDALAVLDACDADAAHVAGLSLGGVTALWLAINAPARVRTLVLANTAAYFGPAQRWIDRIALLREQGMMGIADMVVRNWFTPAFAERKPDEVAGFRRALTACPPDGYIGCCSALGDVDARTDLGRIHAPTLVIGGAGDVATPLTNAEFLAAQIPGARLVTLEAGHLSNVEQPEAFTQAVVEFISIQGNEHE